MRIESSQLSFATEHSLATTDTTIVQTIARPVSLTAPSINPQPAVQSGYADTVNLSGLASTFAGGGRDDLEDMDPKERLAALAIEALVGHRINWLHYRSTGASAQPATSGAGAAQAQQRTEIHSETEQTSFQAKGSVQTTDGRTVDFNVSLTMARDQVSSSTAAAPPPNTADPLVLNFGGAPARLTGGKISFDLNSDGVPEQISFVSSGSGFLVRDANNDGKVNDGQELFGPQSGNGFADLAKYDSDGNGWIDEGDPVFSQLRIWSADGLQTLAEKGIGAIATSSVETPFAIKDGNDTTQGEVRSTGVYLSEGGPAGTVQQVDLAVG